MKRSYLVVLLAVLLIVALSVAAFAQDSVASLFKPVAVSISQNVPTEVTIAVPLEDGEMYTTTVPLTFTVDLHVTVSGNSVVSLTAAESDPHVTIKDVQDDVEDEVKDTDGFVDNNEIAYTIDDPYESYEFVEVATRVRSEGSFTLMGVVKNTGDDDGDVKFLVTFYDADGDMLAVEDAYPGTPQLGPGVTASFETSILEPLEDVSSYRIEVGAR